MRKYLTEFVGTLFFVMTIGLVVTPNHPLAPLVIGTVLMVIVYMGGHVSGGHYNPAVSLAVFLRGKLPGSELVPYIGAQVLGAIAGAYLSYMMLDHTFAPEPAATATVMTALMVEVFYTFLLALVVLNVATSPATEGNSYYGLAIGATIVVAAFAGGPVSGGAFNPAIGTGAIVVNSLAGGGSWSHLWLYLVGPLAGGALAAAVYRIQEGIA
ncbi:MAG TPA: MIP/aquaporin family protein [Gemmatimonadales bacterium]|jgi:aquaporin Z|nr:MIP/aquaporin family protein [Gemmatimonadales bacterium]